MHRIHCNNLKWKYRHSFYIMTCMCKHKRTRVWVTVPQLSPCKTHFAKWGKCGVSAPLIDNDVQLMSFSTNIRCWLVNHSMRYAPGAVFWGEFIFAMNSFDRFVPFCLTRSTVWCFCHIFLSVVMIFLKSALCFNEGLNLKRVLGELASCVKEHYRHYTGGAKDLRCQIKPCCQKHIFHTWGKASH